ncbi:sensor histidine kinase [Ramlibacter algicola]|uniref:histidine kinase n=1 Tax=Ramlibacter algicola TaxID=2795217 RepID=A0A934UQB4_9BURK|nr:PAS domain-containing sensor histidine kinase [Ramlibacter algicola]MBK0392454.1 PAS domain-containing sensor histidine kinase [Ramlibacter algicola]
MTPEPTSSPGNIEDRLQLLVEAVVDYGIFVLDPQGLIVTWNSGAQKLKGWTRSEILGRHFSIFYPPEAVASGWPQEELRRATRDGRFEDEGWRLRKDGSRFWANVVITALRDPATHELTGFAKVTRDLTERRAHEEALRASEERFRLLVDSVEDHAIFMLDRGGLVQSWNKAAETILGYPASTIMGRHLGLVVPDADREAGHPQATLDGATRHGRIEEEGWRVRHDGSRFWAKSVTTAVYGRSGELLGFAVVLQDKSQQKRLEDLERSSRRMSEFIAMLAHELRNPLAPIRNAVTLMQLDKQLPDRHARVRDIIDRQLTQLTRLVDDLLDVSRLTTGKITLRPERVSLAEVVRHSIETVRPQIDARGHELTVSLPADEELVVEGDPTRLAQVVQNMLVNAAKYTPEGGRVQVRARRCGSEAEVEVQDNGRGIDAQDLERIFELFAQAETSGLPQAGVDGGLGVGLALSRALVRMHRGKLGARSDGPGRGSTFSMRLPLASR